MFLNKKIDATQGNLTKIIWQLAWPLVIVNLIQVIYNFTDTFWVGQLQDSKQAIAAVSSSFTIVFLMISLAIGLTVATSALVSQFFGAKDQKNLEASCYTSIILITLIAIAVSIIGLALKHPLLRLINTPPDIYEYAAEYFTIILSGMVFMFMFFVFSSILRGVGDTVTPMIAGIVSGIINMILDPILIFGWGSFQGLGVAGAAYATVIARFVVALYLLWFIFSGKKHFKLSFKKIVFDLGIAKKIVKIGIPAGISQVFLSIGGTVLLSRVNSFGTVASSAYGLGHRIDSLMFLPAMSLSQAVATAIGQNMGANKNDRAMKVGRIAILHGFTISAIIGIVLLIFPTALFNLMFSKAGVDVISLAKNYVIFMSFGYAFITVRIVINGIFQGAGAAKYLMAMTIISLSLRMLLAYLFSYTSMGVNGVFLGIAVSFVFSATLMFIVYSRKGWLKSAIIKFSNKDSELDDDKKLVTNSKA